MSDDILTPEDEFIEDDLGSGDLNPDDFGSAAGDEPEMSDHHIALPDDTSDNPRRLKGMYRNWFLEYASYVILERAVPHLADGLKPVQRRILHSMKNLDDGRFNKVANIVGNTMQFHPHGNASIYEALIQIGQKALLVETQGNWGNILTGDPAAADRYIEARLSTFALETIYNPKITDWTMSYDGRNREPVTLPVKFPLLLFQGVEGIAVGLSSKILPHNFNEIIDAAIACLRGEEFVLYPDFVTGGYMDVSRYNDGKRGGAVRVRAKIEKIDSKTLAITELPFGRTSKSLSESIVKAIEKGKIKAKKVEDQTAESARIVVTLLPGTSSDKTIDALYAFTDCEISISPNCCVIDDEKPRFMGVSEVLTHNVHTTRTLLGKELQIQLDEVAAQYRFASLEKIFIEKRIYKDKAFEQSETIGEAIEHVRGRLLPFVKKLTTEISDDEILRLMEIRMKRILKFNADDADRFIESCVEKMKNLRSELERLTEYTIDWFQALKDKYGAKYPRHTVIRNFSNIEAAAVAEANEKLYINRQEGFIGTSLKKDEYICNCSNLDDIIIFYKDGRYKVMKVAEKIAVEKNVLFVNVFKRNDLRTIYNVIYQDGKGGTDYMKRFAVTGVTRDKEYNVTRGTAGSKICWFSANSNGEAETVTVILKPKPRLKSLQIDVDFSELAIKGKQSQGNIVTRNEVHRFRLKKEGVSTLGGLKVWFDPDVQRLNNDARGRFIGEFGPNDRILVIYKNGDYCVTGFDNSTHFDEDILQLEKLRPNHPWTAILFDADQGFYYLKRFTFEDVSRRQSFIGDNPESRLVDLSDAPGARFEITFGGNDAQRQPIEIVARDFIAVKSFRAKGKRLTMFEIDKITELESLPDDTENESEEDADQNDNVNDQSIIVNPETGQTDSSHEMSDNEDNEMSDDELRDALTGQIHLF
ncbi:MAG: DNA gyrase/topoisomerase IV subunit A [Muribaculaceae bacterium]|nr:DNA gyrase/topoisomerase IV subunit A [Muribaculaceae bacterium]